MALPELRSGRIDVENYLEHATALFVCDDGYSLVGNPRVTCGGDGAWSSGPPTCLHVWLHVVLPLLAFVAVAATCIIYSRHRSSVK